jgi:flagellar protein FlaF
MGISVSASTAVVFLGVFIAAGTLYPAVSNGVEQVTTAQQQQGDRVLAQQNTDIDVTNATYNTTTGKLRVNVTNTGTTTLDVPETNVLVDGAPNSTENDFTTSIAGDTDTTVWLPGETLNVSVDPGDAGTSGETPPARIQVVVEYGVSDGRTVTEVS